MSSTCDSCDSTECSAKEQRANENSEQFLEWQEIARRMCKITNSVAVISGKGGVGKSTVAVNMAVSLAIMGNRVGLMDVDVHGPSIPTMLNLADTEVHSDENGIYPLEMGNLKVISVGYLLNHEDDPVIFRGPRKMGLIKQFIKDVEWGELDYLIIDTPPGTGDEQLSVIQLIEDLTGAVIVTTPQEVSGADVRKSINFCRQMDLKTLGLIENMAGFVCPGCGETHPIFGEGGGQKIADAFELPLLGSIPLDPAIGKSGDSGKPFIYHYAKTETAQKMKTVIDTIETLIEKERPMRFAIPMAAGKLTMHFGHCEQFAVIDTKDGKIVETTFMTPPPHEPGVLPNWIGNEIKADLVLAGGMGIKAQNIIAQHNVKVIVGCEPKLPEELVADYFADTLVSGANACDH
jgi:ATP-binding protein involved in chromosome partitioning